MPTTALKALALNLFDRRAVEPGNAVTGIKVIALRLPLMAGLAASGILAHVDRLVGPEPLELPVAGAATFVIVGAPAAALFHDEISVELAIPMVDEHEIGAARVGCPFLTASIASRVVMMCSVTLPRRTVV